MSQTHVKLLTPLFTSGVKKGSKGIKRPAKPGYVKDMIKAAVLMCVNAHVPVIAGVFTTNRQQQIAEEIGFQKYNEIVYEKYTVDGDEVFDTSGTANTGAVFMAYRIPDVEEPLEVESQHSSRFSLQSDNAEGE